jgi:hypothetical protein
MGQNRSFNPLDSGHVIANSFRIRHKQEGPGKVQHQKRGNGKSGADV